MDDSKRFNQYLGPLYVGDDYQRIYAVYDTMSSYTVISKSYDTTDSKSFKQAFSNGSNPIEIEINIADLKKGTLYYENFCIL
jgi:hypothetical protein